jgi:hypothetical protein
LGWSRGGIFGFRASRCLRAAAPRCFGTGASFAALRVGPAGRSSILRRSSWSPACRARGAIMGRTGRTTSPSGTRRRRPLFVATGCRTGAERAATTLHPGALWRMLESASHGARLPTTTPRSGWRAKRHRATAATERHRTSMGTERHRGAWSTAHPLTLDRRVHGAARHGAALETIRFVPLRCGAAAWPVSLGTARSGSAGSHRSWLWSTSTHRGTALRAASRAVGCRPRPRPSFGLWRPRTGLGTVRSRPVSRAQILRSALMLDGSRPAPGTTPGRPVPGSSAGRLCLCSGGRCEYDRDRGKCQW